MLELLPNVLENLKAAAKYEAFMKFMKLVANDAFPLDNIAFLLFLDIVKWFSEDNSSNMKYLYPETVQFWRIGQKLFHGRFLRFMSGPKNQGQIVQGSTYRGVYDTKESNINFAVPSASVLRKMNPFEKDSLKPGLIDEVLTSLSEIDDGNTYKLAIDAKKISRGRERSSEMLICLDSNKKSYQKRYINLQSRKNWFLLHALC